MSETINILHISVDFNYSCGVSKHVYSLLKNFVQNKSYKVYFLTNGGDALERLQKINLTPEIINFSKGLQNVFNIYSNLRSLKEFCLENKIHIIHTHHRYPEFLAYLISKKTGVKTITTVESLVKGKTKLSFKSDKIIAVSNSVKNMLTKSYKVPNEKIIMLNNFLDPPDTIEEDISLNIKSELDIPVEDKIILFIGRITKIKGVDLLIEAFKIVRQKNKKIFLLIIGQIYDDSLKNLMKNLPDQVKLLNIVKNPYPYYSIADLVVMPSRVEPFPYVMLEVGIMNKPFIGAKTGGISEFIEDGKNGLLFESENINELSSKIDYILNNTQDAKIMAANLNKKVKEQMSCERYISKLTQIYDDLLM